MLQIITGKFFITDKLTITRHRRVLYTNYQLIDSQPIETRVGTILPATTWTTTGGGGVANLIYEVDERLEAVRPDGSNELLRSVGGDYLPQDFCAVLAFALSITCSLDLDLTRRLTQSSHASLGVSDSPSKFIKRVFNKRIEFSEGDDLRLQNFVDDLVGLERQKYKAVMQAIRRYVTGLHRLADDLDLAYALLVASIESLAQKFNTPTPQWEDYPQEKRQELEKAWANAPRTAEKVKAVLLKYEHVALKRRFREFTLHHVSPSFFRTEAAQEARPVGSNDLSIALRRAYDFRSGYFHVLQHVPKLIKASSTYADTIMFDGKPVLTFHGLARVARHVIHQFVAHAPKVEREEFDWRTDLPNTMEVMLAERCWIWNEKGFNHKSARRYLGGFLSELSAVLTKQPDAAITEIPSILTKIEKSVSGLAKPKQRLPMLTLYYIWHLHTPAAYHRPNWKDCLNAYVEDFKVPSIECMLAHLLADHQPEWSLEQFQKMYDAYFRQRYNKDGLAFGPLFEAALTLDLADLYRQCGSEAHARELVTEAVENNPGDRRLLNFEQIVNEQPMPAISWSKILLPQT